MRNCFFNFKSLENRMSFLPIIPVEYTTTHIYKEIKRERWNAWRHQIFLNSIQKRTIEGLQKFSYLMSYIIHTWYWVFVQVWERCFWGSLSLNLKKTLVHTIQKNWLGVCIMKWRYSCWIGLVHLHKSYFPIVQDLFEIRASGYKMSLQRRIRKDPAPWYKMIDAISTR